MKRRPGRPPNPQGTQHVMKAFRFPPDLWAEVLAWIPNGERTAIITRCLRREIARRKAASKEGSNGPGR